MKNICFIANYYKTPVFLEIAKVLEQHSICSYWIVPSKKQFLELGKVLSDDKILYIGKKEVLAANTCTEKGIDLKINELVYGDRVLRHESAKWTFSYLRKLTGLYFDFLKSNKIGHIFGEATWAHELLAHRIATRYLECKFLSPQTIRIPNGKFAFFKDEFLSSIEETKHQSGLSYEAIKVEKPAYLGLNDKLLSKKGTLKHNLILLKNFILRTNQDVNDPTLYSNPLTQFRIRTNEILNRIVFNNFINETEINDLPKDKRMIFVTLHKQPEASVDVNGRYYENQLELICNIWRILPENYILLVKEHSNAIGDRNFKFYKSVKNLRNTYLINNKTDSHKVLRASDAVFTISGTVAYEAALEGRRAFTFAPTYFNKITSCDEVSWKDFKYGTLKELVNNPKGGFDVQEFSNWLLTNSFDGILSDSFSDPRSISKENIAKLAVGFLNIIN